MEENHTRPRLPARSSPMRTATSIRAFQVDVLVPGLLALILGLITLGRKAWWFDEAYDIWLAQNPWVKYIAKAGYYEPSQALYLVFFKFWTIFTPESEWFTRFPSVVAAAAAAALVGVLGTRLFNRSTGLLAGILMATNATVVAWSQQTRTYALAALAAVVVTLLVLCAMESESRRPWLIYGIAGGIGIYAHFFIGFVLASHAVLLPRMSATQKRLFREAWAIIALALVVAAPFVAVAGHGNTNWIPPTSWHQLRVAISTLIGFNALALVAAGIGAVAILVDRTQSAARWKGVLLGAWAVSPLIGALIVSVIKPMLVGRFLIVSTPALALLGGAALNRIRPRWIAAGGAILLLALSMKEVVAWYGKVPEDWRGASRFVAAVQKRTGSTVALYPTGNLIPYELYASLPAQCRHLAGHQVPRCNFHAVGPETLVITTEPGWRKLPRSRNYVVAGERHFGERIKVIRLERKWSNVNANCAHHMPSGCPPA
jgi:mannosyltransferase